MTTVDALSKVAAQSAASLKWSQLYDNTVAFAAPARVADSFYIGQLDTYADIDSLGFAPRKLAVAMGGRDGFISVRTEFILADGDVGTPPDVADVAAVFTRTIAPNDMIGGRGNKVVIEQLKRTPTKWNSETPQCWAMIGYRYDETTAVPPLCYQFTVKVPDNLSDILTHTEPATYTGWFEFFAFKEGVNNAETYHRYGLFFEKKPGDTGMRFTVRFDLFYRDLSGNVIPSNIPKAVWRMESAEGSLEDGKQYTIYFYVDQKLDYTDLSGVTSIVITNDTDQTVAMSDSVTGVPTCGYSNTPIGRPIFHGVYTGGFPSTGTIVIEYGNTFIWDAPPIAMPAPRIGTLL